MEFKIPMREDGEQISDINTGKSSFAAMAVTLSLTVIQVELEMQPRAPRQLKQRRKHNRL